jgi:hypothetical protein
MLIKIEGAAGQHQTGDDGGGDQHHHLPAAGAQIKTGIRFGSQPNL